LLSLSAILACSVDETTLHRSGCKQKDLSLSLTLFYAAFKLNVTLRPRTGINP
jgi:hypothetical protein